MKVIVRKQITEIVTRRQVSHRLRYNGVDYLRMSETRVITPYMDLGVVTDKPKTTWYQYTELGGNCMLRLYNPETKRLGLEELYQKINLNERNGNKN